MGLCGPSDAQSARGPAAGPDDGREIHPQVDLTLTVDSLAALGVGARRQRRDPAGSFATGSLRGLSGTPLESQLARGPLAGHRQRVERAQAPWTAAVVLGGEPRARILAPHLDQLG